MRTPSARTSSLSCLLALLAVMLPAGGCAPGDGPRRLLLANVHAPGYPTARALTELAAAVERHPLLGRRIRLDVQLGGVLGGERETLEKLRFGGIQMACVSAAPLAEFCPAVGVLTLPYLFASSEEMWRVLEGPLGTELLAAGDAIGIAGLAWYDAGARSFYNRRRPVLRREDLEGLRIRVQASEVMRATVEALGASPVALGFKDVYTNLYTGALDGAENNVPSYRSERHFEAARFYSLDRHSMIPDVLLVSRDVWTDLSGEEREALAALARESTARQRELWETYAEEALEAVEAAGAQVREVEDLEGFRRAVEPVYERFREPYGELVGRIRAAAAEAEPP